MATEIEQKEHQDDDAIPFFQAKEPSLPCMITRHGLNVMQARSLWYKLLVGNTISARKGLSDRLFFYEKLDDLAPLSKKAAPGLGLQHHPLALDCDIIVDDDTA